MRIFYITSVLGDVGGSEIYTRDLLKELSRRGHEVCVFTTADYDIEGIQSVLSPTWGHHAFHKFQSPLFVGKALKAAKQFGPDIVQSHSNSLMGWIGSRVSAQQKIPHLLLIELISSENHNLHTKTIHFMEKMLLPRVSFDKIVVWTKLMQDKFLEPWGVDPKKIEVIPPAINFENYKAENDPNPIYKQYGKNLITSFKSLWGSSARGIEYIIEAMPLVIERFPEYKYVVFGWGKEKERLEKKATSLGLSKSVLFHGPAPPNLGGSIAAATTVSPHSFVYEISFSMSLMEYMAWGVPCVVTDIGSAREIVKDTALLVAPKNPHAMANGISRMLEDKELRKEFSVKSRRLVMEKYSIKNTVDKLESIYESMLKARKKAKLAG